MPRSLINSTRSIGETSWNNLSSSWCDMTNIFLFLTVLWSECKIGPSSWVINIRKKERCIMFRNVAFPSCRRPRRIPSGWCTWNSVRQNKRLTCICFIESRIVFTIQMTTSRTKSSDMLVVVEVCFLAFFVAISSISCLEEITNKQRINLLV